MYVRIQNPARAISRTDLAVLEKAPWLDNVMGVIVAQGRARYRPARGGRQSSLSIERARALAANRLSVMPLMKEPAWACTNTYELCRSTPRVAGVALASAEQGDFMVDLGGRWTPHNLALAYPRGKDGGG